MTTTDALKIIHYPDPRLKKLCEPVTRFDDDLRALAERMLGLMRQAKGVGLAAPQVGRLVRLFVMNPTGEPGDDRVYANPVLTPLGGEVEAEEGCLSLPEVRIDVLRSDRVRLEAHDLDGRPVIIEDEGFVTRVWQHETDHLQGVLLTDRMGFSDKMRHRKRLRDLEAKFVKNVKKR